MKTKLYARGSGAAIIALAMVALLLLHPSSTRVGGVALAQSGSGEKALKPTASKTAPTKKTSVAPKRPTAKRPTPAKSTPRPTAPIHGGVLTGKAISLPKPEYPKIASSARASGLVVVQVTIDESGKVISARAVSGHPLLQAAAVKAAYGARFSPKLISGMPVKVTGTLSYNFVQ